MTPSTRDRLVAGAVRVGSLGLFGLPTFLVTVRTVEIIASLAGTSLSGDWRAVASVIALVLSLEVASGVAAVRIHGYAALTRGGRLRALVRHATLSIAVLAALVVTLEFLVSVFARAVPREYTLLLGLVSVVAIAVAWAFARALSAFYRGYRGNDGI